MDKIIEYAQILSREHPGSANRDFAYLVLTATSQGTVDDAFLEECAAAALSSRSSNVRKLAGMVLAIGRISQSASSR